MFKLILEEAEEPEIKLPISIGSSEKQESSRKTSISALLTVPKPLTVWITIACGKFLKRWECQIMKLKYVKMSIISGTQNIYLTWVFVIYYIYRFSFEYLLGIPDRLTCLLRNLYAGQEATVRTGHGTTDWFQIGKGVHQGCILWPCLFNLYVEYILRNAGLEEAQAGIKIAGKYQ